MSVDPFRLTQTNATSVAIPNPRQLRPTVAIAAAALALCLASLVLTARADAYVYWTNSGTDTIGRADLDGTNVNPEFITGADNPVGIAVDANHVYWTNSGTGTIGRADLDGTNVNPGFITADNPVGIAVDANHVYWADPRSAIDGGTIGRANLDGTGFNQSFIALLTLPQGVAVDGGHVYWTGGFPATTIGRADLDGTNFNGAFIPGGGQGLAVDAHYLYWTDQGTGLISRNDLDGVGSPSPLIPLHTSFTGGLAVDADHVYWTNFTTIGRANLDGTGVDQSFIGSLDVLEDSLYDAEGVAVDDLPRPPETTPPDTAAPQTKITKGAANKTDKTKIKFKFTSSEPDSTFECGLASRKFKPCTSPKTIKNLDQGKHKFRVRAIDAAGNVDSSAAKDKFKVVG